MQQVVEFFAGATFGLGTVYWVCLFVGAIIAVLSFIVGDILDFAADAGDFGPFSGPVIAIFLVLFGGGGLVFKEILDVSPVSSALGGGIVAFGGSGVFYFLFAKFILGSQGGTTFDPKDFVGKEARILTPIPAGGTGEITFDHESGRFSGAAQAADGSAIGRNAIVEIERYVAGTYVVKQLIAGEAVEAHDPANAPEPEDIEEEKNARPGE